jgi:hypothetical protein
MYQFYSNDAEAATRQWLEGTSWTFESVDQSGNGLVITVIGTGDPPPIDELKATLRAEIPDYIPISLIEDSGRTTDL